MINPEVIALGSLAAFALACVVGLTYMYFNE